MDEMDYSAVEGEQLNNKTELTVKERFGVKPFSAFHGVVDVRGSTMEFFR